MTKTELIDEVSKKVNITKTEAGEVFDTLIEVIKDTLKKGEKITVIGFGSFSVSERKARPGRNPKTGEPIIDWESTRVIYLKMDNIYIHPDGLDGKWNRASGPEYERLRDKVIRMLYDLKDETGVKPVAVVARWEEAENYFDLPEDRVGDLIIANESGFGWNEEVNSALKVFSTPLKTGYKQAILPRETKEMWTPFMIMGPGVKKIMD